jgi:hypothetical protein
VSYSLLKFLGSGDRLRPLKKRDKKLKLKKGEIKFKRELDLTMKSNSETTYSVIYEQDGDVGAANGVLTPYRLAKCTDGMKDGGILDPADMGKKVKYMAGRKIR